MNIRQIYEEGRLIRHKWSDVKDGQQLLCLYTAMMNDKNARPISCPADVCPKWLAHLLPWMDDRGTMEAWGGMVKRVAELAPYFGKLSSGLEDQVKVIFLQDLMQNVSSAELKKICQKGIFLFAQAVVDEEKFVLLRKKFNILSINQMRLEISSWLMWILLSNQKWSEAWAASTAIWLGREEQVDCLTTKLLDLIELDLIKNGAL